VDVYNIWCNLRDTSQDLEFAARLDDWLGWLQREGRIEGYRLGRRKLGFGPAGLGEFHVTVEVRDLAQLDTAFGAAATRAGEAEARHSAVFCLVRDAVFGLERDFPDPARVSEPRPGTTGRG
jgi:hypothetical protein